MSCWLVSLTAVALTLGQADLPQSGEAPQEAIARAIDQLGARQFSVRRQASRFLWQQGLAAEPALRRATESPDREVRLRAEMVLNDFLYGILPDVPEEINTLLRRFRDGDVNQRLASLQALADRAEFERVERLIGLEGDAGVRRNLLVYLMRVPRAVEHFLELNRLEKLIDTVGADQDVAWRRTVLAQMLFSEIMLRRLVEKDNLDVLMKVVDREPSADVRREMLSRLFENASAVASLMETGQLDFVLKLIAMEPQLRVRGQWIQQMMVMSEAIKQLIEGDRLDKFLDFARDNVEPEQQATILQRALQHPDVVKAILDKRGVDGLIAMSSSEKDPGERGKLLATIVASSGVRAALNEDGQRDLILQLGRQEKQAAARNEYMKGVLASGYGYSLFRDADSRKALWELIKTEASDAGAEAMDWRGEAIYRMMTMSSSDDIFREEAEVKWLLAFLGDQVTEEQRFRILQRLLSDYRMQRILNGEQYFEPLLALVQKIPDNQRGSLLGRLISLTTVQRLAAAGQIQRVVALARDETNEEARKAYLQSLFRNESAMSSLLEGDFYDQLWQFVVDEKDAVRHAELRGDFYSTNTVVTRLQEKKQLDVLVEFARQQTVAQARREYLVRLFRNYSAMTLLIDAKHYDTLFGMADGDEDEDERATLLSAFYVNPKVLEHLAAEKQIGQALEFAEKNLSGNSLRNFLQQICQQESTVAAIVEQGQLEKAIALVRMQKEDYYQGYLLRMVLAAPPVVQHYGSAGKLKELFELIASVSEKTRYQIWEGLLQRTENVAVMVKNDGLDDLVKRLGEEPQAQRRGMLIGSLLAQQAVVEHLVAKKELPAIFEIVRQQEQPEARQNLLRTLFASEPAIGALLGAGAFDDLYDLASGENDEQQRSLLLAQLLSNGKTVEHLVAAKRVDRLLHVASQQAHVAIRRQVLTRILASSAATEALIEDGHFDQLVKLCRLDTDASSRRRLLASLLNSRTAVDHLIAAGSFKPTVLEILGEPEENSRRSLLQNLINRRDSLNLLIEHGMFDALLKVAEAENDPNQRRQLLLPLLTNGNAIRQLAERKRMDQMIQLVTDEIQASGNSYVLQNLFYNQEAIQAVIASGNFEKLLDLIIREDGPANLQSLLANVLSNTATLLYLAERDRIDLVRDLLDKRADDNLRRQFAQRLLSYTEGQRALRNKDLAQLLVDVIRRETEDSYRQSYAGSILGNSRVRQHLLEHGFVEFIHEVAGWLPSETQRRQQMRGLMYAPSGLVAYHLLRGENDQAERLLLEYADDDLGRLRLATYWLLSGRIDEQINAVRQRLEQTPSPDDTRLLIYLYRAHGDLESAYRLARETQDAGLQKALLVEMRRWSEAAALQQSDLCPLPIAWVNPSTVTQPRLVLEQLSLTAAYQRLAGDSPACEQTIQQLLQAADSQTNDATLQWMCIEALLLNDRVEDGLQRLIKSDPARAFDFLVVRHQYREALQLLGWQDGSTLDQAWLDGLPVDGGKDESGQAIQRFERALKVARVLHSLGRSEQVETLIDSLEEYSLQQPDSNSSNSPRRQCCERLSQALVWLGQEDRAWVVAMPTLFSPDSPPPSLSRLYGQRYSEAQAWWSIFRRRHGSEPATETFARVHRVMNPSPDEGTDEFEKLIQDVVQWIDATGSSGSDSTRIAIARTCVERKRPELAEQLLKDADSSNTDVLEIQADLCWRDERWDQAAELFERLWQDDHDRLADLYLSGEALRRAGKQAEGDQRTDLVHRLALDSRARFMMARGLVQRGLKDQAVDQFHVVLRTAPLEYWEWNESARYLGEQFMATQPAVAADWFDFSLLDDLRSYFYLLRDADYLRTPALVHRLRAAAAIDAGDLDAARQHARAALAAAPAETAVGEELVPRLDAAGQREAAEELFQEQYRLHVQWCADWPESALLNNNLAWLAARSGRLLDTALKHAERAVQLEPNASHLDTLAEVHFRLGDREKAIEYSKRSVALDPDSDTLRGQLGRFQNDPLPKPQG